MPPPARRLTLRKHPLPDSLYCLKDERLDTLTIEVAPLQGSTPATASSPTTAT
jgi:hypothetical protein